jgi:hypothetical protein
MMLEFIYALVILGSGLTLFIVVCEWWARGHMWRSYQEARRLFKLIVIKRGGDGHGQL